MTIYDALMVGVLVAGTVWGAMRGITWQLAGIASLVLGYALAFPLSAELAPHFPGEPVIARGLAMLVVYLAVSGSVYLVAWLIRATLRKLRFEAFDRHLGMLLGGAQGTLLGIVVTVFVVSLSPGSREPILTSPSGKVVNSVLDALQPALPGELRTVLAPFWDENESGGDQIAQAEPDTDALPKSRGAGIPTDASAALDWFDEALPVADEMRRANDSAVPGSTRPLDPSILRSALERGADVLLNRSATAGAPSDGSPASPASAAQRSSYWWEDKTHGRDSRRR